MPSFRGLSRCGSLSRRVVEAREPSLTSRYRSLSDGANCLARHEGLNESQAQDHTPHQPHHAPRTSTRSTPLRPAAGSSRPSPSPMRTRGCFRLLSRTRCRFVPSDQAAAARRSERPVWDRPLRRSAHMLRTVPRTLSSSVPCRSAPPFRAERELTGFRGQNVV